MTVKLSTIVGTLFQYSAFWRGKPTLKNLTCALKFIKVHDLQCAALYSWPCALGAFSICSGLVVSLMRNPQYLLYLVQNFNIFFRRIKYSLYIRKSYFISYKCNHWKVSKLWNIYILLFWENLHAFALVLKNI